MRTMLCIDATNATRINRVVDSLNAAFFDPILRSGIFEVEWIISVCLSEERCVES